MAEKKIIIKPKKSIEYQNKNLDEWVKNRVIEKEKIKRLTIDIPESLHKKIKSSCALRGNKISDEIREILINHYT